ncbi:MAG: hypothetical protein ABIA67_06315 [Candidatus Margulisiibacteriota bacterium]
MSKEFSGQDDFTLAWQQLNRSDFADQTAREAILSLVNPLVDPRTTNCTIASIRFINTMTDLGLKNDLGKYLAQPTHVVQEMAIHRAATTGDILAIIMATNGTFGYVPEHLRDLYMAALEYRYQPNPSWLERMHQFSKELLTEIARKLSADHASASGEQQRLVESALVATAIARSSATFEQVIGIVPELAARIRADRDTFLHGRFAYHYTKEELMGSIVEKGLGIKYAPEGSERPDVLCFNNAQYAGIEYVLLGVHGYYVKDYLLRVPLDTAPFGGGMRGPSQEFCDLTADYTLGKDHVIPPEKIEIVDPMIATRAVPLVI